MTIWEKYDKEQRTDYEEYLKMYGALSAMFNQKSSETGASYLDSKFQETIYARSFNSEDVDIGNTGSLSNLTDACQEILHMFDEGTKQNTSV